MYITALLILVLLALYYVQYQHLTERVIQGSKTKRAWSVVGSYENSKEAAEALSRLHDKLIVFFRHLTEKYHISETDEEIANCKNHIYGGRKREIAYHILRDYNPDRVYENNPAVSSDTSYTINKGASLYMCVRNRKNPNKIENDDLLLFVMLHELSHIGNVRSWGHGTDFWAIFKHVLHEAEESGIYKPVQYAYNPQTFCGLEITYNPYYDNTLPAIED
jgi:hypothetical protein